MQTHHRVSHQAAKFALGMLALGLWLGEASAEQIGPETATVAAAMTAKAANGDTARTDVRDLLMSRLNPELAASFRLFVYVDKAASGSGAQRMSVFVRTSEGQLALLHDWPVSTGRERIERDAEDRTQSSVTPTGYFEIDPRRVYVNHMSGQWHEPMPYAMFFAAAPGGLRTGLAIHGTDDTQAGLLGTRASAGCVRLSLENAQALFTLVRSTLRVPTPLLAAATGDAPVSPADLLAHDASGRPVMVDGYSVLVVIDDSTPPAQIEVSALTPPTGSAQ